MKNKDIRNYNDKGDLHGYQEWYWHNDEFNLRGVWKNGRPIGYDERHNWKITIYYIT